MNGFLMDIVRFCNVHNAPDARKGKHNIGYLETDVIHPTGCEKETAERNLAEWILRSSSQILNHVIPEKFWSENDLSKPNVKRWLCPLDTSGSVVVLLVVLWSRCSKKCHTDVTDCLIYGAKNWQIDDTFKPIDWLRAYVKSIWICVLFYRRSIRVEAEKENLRVFAKLTILLDAFSLSQAVANSSEWFGMVTSKQLPTTLLPLFINAYVGKRKLAVKFTGPLLDLIPFSVNNRTIVTQMSNVTWFKINCIVPILRRMMALGPMAELALEMKKLSDTPDVSPSHIKTFQRVSRKAVLNLGIELSDKKDIVPFTLAAIAQFAQELTRNETEPRKSSNEELVCRVISPTRLWKIICPTIVDCIFQHKKKGIEFLKEMIAKKPPLFSDDLVNNLAIFTCEWDSLNNAKKSIPKSQSSGLNSWRKLPRKNSPIRKNATPAKASAKMKSTTKPTKGTPTGGEPELANREKKVPAVKVGKKGKTTVQNSRKTNLVEEGGGTQTSNSTSTMKTVKEASPEKSRAPQVPASQQTRRILHKRKCNSDKGKQGKEGRDKKRAAITLIKYATQVKGNVEEKKTVRKKVSKNVKHIASGSSNLTDKKSDALLGDTSKEQDHKGEKGHDMAKLCRVVLQYFNGEGEMKSYDDRWIRCKHIYETHQSQQFQSCQDLPRDLVVKRLLMLSLALLSLEEMMKAPNESDKLSKDTFKDIESCMKTFKFDSNDAVVLMCHIICTSQLLTGEREKTFSRKMYEKYYQEQLRKNG